MEMDQQLAPPQAEKRESWRNLVAFWFLGLCNNLSYVIMLSAAHDVLHPSWNSDDGSTTTTTVAPPVGEGDPSRQCNLASTSTILLADIVPSLLVKVSMPYVLLNIHFKMVSMVALTIASLLLVAFSNALWQTYLGVALTSLASGLGEMTLLSYSSAFHANVLSSWASGTGGAGFFGALGYAGLISLGLSSRHTILLFLCVPVTMGIMFWLVMTHPSSPGGQHALQNEIVDLKQHLKEVPKLFRYMIPLFLVYFSEYFINQGLMELMYFPNAGMELSEQYRWYQVDYQLGVLISRSSVNLVHIKKIGLLSFLQFVNAILCVFIAIYWFLPSIWIVLAIIFYEGLLGGGVYINAFFRIHHEVEEARKPFALSVTSAADTAGIVLSAFLAMPVHNAICKLPAPK